MFQQISLDGLSKIFLLEFLVSHYNLLPMQVLISILQAVYLSHEIGCGALSPNDGLTSWIGSTRAKCLPVNPSLTGPDINTDWPEIVGPTV